MAIKIGVSADLDKGASIHRRTFYEAVHIGLDISGCVGEVTLVFASDSACQKGGRMAANTIMMHGVDAVVGHYASAAAWSACAEYKKRRLPVFLPAATHPGLDRIDENIFQVCPNDRVLCRQILNYVKSLGYVEVFLECDNTLHGSTIVEILSALLPESGIALAMSVFKCECIVYSGMFVNSIQYVKQVRQGCVSVPVFLTDDALHPSIFERLSEFDNVHIFGIAPSIENDACKAFVTEYRRYANAEPATYLIQTIVSMQMAIQSGNELSDKSRHHNIHNIRWRTMLGCHTIDDIKYILASHAVWKIHSGSAMQTALPGLRA